MASEIDTSKPFQRRGPETEVSPEQQLERRRELDDIRWLLGHKQGRRIAWRLLEWAGVFRSSFTGNAETYFREGMRNIGLMFVAEIHEACPEQYLTMVKEHQEHGRRNAGDGRAS